MSNANTDNRHTQTMRFRWPDKHAHTHVTNADTIIKIKNNWTPKKPSMSQNEKLNIQNESVIISQQQMSSI